MQVYRYTLVVYRYTFTTVDFLHMCTGTHLGCTGTLCPLQVEGWPNFIFVRLFCKLSSSGSSDQYHFGGTRSVLSWETIVHYPRYKLRGQIRLKDTMLSLGLDLLSNHCLFLYYCFRFVFFSVSVFFFF